MLLIVCNKLAEGVKYNSAKDVFQTPLRVLYYNPLCSVEETWLGHKFLPLMGTLLAVLLEHFIFNSVAFNGKICILHSFTGVHIVKCKNKMYL